MLLSKVPIQQYSEKRLSGGLEKYMFQLRLRKSESIFSATERKISIVASLRNNFSVVAYFRVTFVESIYFLQILETLILFPALKNSKSIVYSESESGRYYFEQLFLKFFKI